MRQESPGAPSGAKVDGVPRAPWWKGARGEWYVVAQLALLPLLLLGPRRLASWPAWPHAYAALGSILGGTLVVTGLSLALTGIFRLGPNLTPLPYPKEHAELIESGPYRIVRHPIYSGVILAALGWGLWVHGWLTMAYAVLLFVFLDLKARREEAWLKARFSDYTGYQRRVKKLLPFVY